jgi:hypothetical protein
MVLMVHILSVENAIRKLKNRQKYREKYNESKREYNRQWMANKSALDKQIIVSTS